MLNELIHAGLISYFGTLRKQVVYKSVMETYK